MFTVLPPQRQRQFKAQKHLLLKNRNELLVGISKCNSLSMQFFNMDVLDIIEVHTFWDMCGEGGSADVRCVCVGRGVLM